MAQQIQELKRALAAVKERVRNAIASDNSESAVSEAERIVWLLYREDPGAAEIVREHAFTQFVAKLIEAERKGEKKTRMRMGNPDQVRLPGFEALPVWVEVFDQRVKLREAIYSQVREFLSQLIREHRAAAEADPQLKQTRALVAKMKAYIARHPKLEHPITVAEVLGLE
jgi:hypothetical protein